jgi:hypothetical protein
MKDYTRRRRYVWLWNLAAKAFWSVGEWCTDAARVLKTCDNCGRSRYYGPACYGEVSE